MADREPRARRRNAGGSAITHTIERWLQASGEGDVAAMLSLAHCHAEAFDEDRFDVRNKRYVADLQAVLDGVSTRSFHSATAPARLSASARRDHAVYWWLQAAHCDDAVACGELASFLFRCGARFHPASVRWFQRSAELGDLPSCLSLGRMLWYGAEGMPADRVLAARWLDAARVMLEAAAVREDGFRSGALIELGQLHLRGEACERSVERALQYWEQAASLGDSGAMRRLGGLYANGVDVGFDADRARHWLEQAMAHGDGWARYDLEQLAEKRVVHERNEGVRAAAAAGDAVAAIKLARQFELGTDGCGIDLELAEHWYRQGACRGHPLAMYELAQRLLARGDGQHRRTALVWLRLAGLEPFARVQPVAAMLAANKAEAVAATLDAADLAEVDARLAAVRAGADGLVVPAD